METDDWPTWREDTSEVAGLIDDYLEEKYPGLSKREHMMRGLILSWMIYAQVARKLGSLRTFVDSTMDLVRNAAASLVWDKPNEKANGNQKAN